VRLNSIRRSVGLTINFADKEFTHERELHQAIDAMQTRHEELEQSRFYKNYHFIRAADDEHRREIEMLRLSLARHHQQQHMQHMKPEISTATMKNPGVINTAANMNGTETPSAGPPKSGAIKAPTRNTVHNTVRDTTTSNAARDTKQADRMTVKEKSNSHKAALATVVA